LFEKLFTDEAISDIVEKAKAIRDFKEDDYILKVANGVENNKDEVDGLFEKFLQNWNKERISKVALCVLRVATYEFLFEKDVPVGAIIDEAVEITKKYSTQEDSAFINGVLGNLARETER
jgi:N utilization substance protein B